jgi:hypothetical protein
MISSFDTERFLFGVSGILGAGGLNHENRFDHLSSGSNKFCFDIVSDRYGIPLHQSPVCHPQANRPPSAPHFFSPWGSGRLCELFILTQRIEALQTQPPGRVFSPSGLVGAFLDGGTQIA